MALLPLCLQLLLTLPHEPHALVVIPSGLFSLQAPCALFPLILVATLSPVSLSQDAVVPGLLHGSVAFNLCITSAEISTCTGGFANCFVLVSQTMVS